MKKTFLFLAAAFFAILNFSCSGGDDNPILIVGPWTTEEPVVTPTDSSGGTQPTPGTTEPAPQQPSPGTSEPGTTEPATQQPAEWNVTYVITNGSDDMASESRTSGKFTAQSELTIPQKEGFQFKGWYLDQAQTQAVASFAGLSGDVVLYGHWAGKLYTVVIEGIDGATLAEGSVAVTGFSTEDQSLALPAYTKRFYTFDGLYLDSGYSGTAVMQIDKSAAAAGATLTLYAKWTLIEWNVTYIITNGSGNMSVELRTGGKYSGQSELTLPQKEGFQFKGWYLDAEQKQPVASFADLTGDLILYGHWAGKLYDVQIVGTDGSALAQGSIPVTGFSTEDQILALPSYTKRFYSFDGLYLDSEFNGTAVTQIDSSCAAAGSTLTLYAKWTLMEYNVTYIITNGSGDMTGESRTSGKYSGESTLAIPQKEGFQFNGWYLDAEQTQAAASFADLTGDLVLYGHWYGVIYTVKIEGVEGAALTQGSVAVTSFTTENEKLVLPVYAKRFYSFDGLYLDSGFNGTAVTQIDSSCAAAGSTLTLYAKWTEKVYTVNYDLLFENGVTNPNTITNLTLSSASQTLSAPTCNDSNYQFAGWFENYSGGIYSNQVTALAVDCASGDDDTITLHAKWIHSTPWTPSGATVLVTTMQTVANDIATLTAEGDEFYLVVTDTSITGQQFRPVNAALKANAMANFYFDFSAATMNFALEDAAGMNPYSFNGCSNLTGITLPECASFTIVERAAFEGCSKLKVVKVPDQVTKICAHSFENCIELETVYLPSQLSLVGENVFYNCLKLKETYFNSTYNNLENYVKFEGNEYSKPTCYDGAFYIMNDNKTMWQIVRSVMYIDSYFTKYYSYSAEYWTVTTYYMTMKSEHMISRAGYDFCGWYDNDKYEGEPKRGDQRFYFNTKNNIKFWAKWTPRNDTPYKVLHRRWDPDINGGCYTIYETETLMGTTDSYVTPTAKDYPGYFTGPCSGQTINGNGQTTFDIYYDKEAFTLTLDLAGGTLDGETGIVTMVDFYGVTVPSVPNPKKTNYTFMGWNTNGGTLPSVYEEDATYTAVWLLNEVRGIDIAVDPLSDISVTKSQSGNTVTFTAEECDSYSWALDGAEKGSARTCSINTSNLLKGTYTLTLEAQKGGRWFSYTAQIKVN